MLPALSPERTCGDPKNSIAKASMSSGNSNINDFKKELGI
jgi:hypothetical protein